MLLLVTLALVVASAVLLVLGFVQSALGFIYLSMVCAGVAALALFVFARLARRRGTALAGAGVAGVAADARVGRSPARTDARADAASARRAGRAAPVTAAGSDGDGADDDDWSAFGPDDTDRWEDRDGETGGEGSGRYGPGLQETGELEPVRVAADDRAEGGPDDGYDDWGDEIVFPIEDYDDLRVAEILPLLSQLEPDELQEVRDREVAGKARATILDRIDDRLDRARRAAAAPKAPARRTAARKATSTAAPEPGSGEATADRPAKKAAARRKPAGATPARAAGADTTRARRSGAGTAGGDTPGDPEAEASRAPAEAAAAEAAAAEAKQAPARRSPGARKPS